MSLISTITGIKAIIRRQRSSVKPMQSSVVVYVRDKNGQNYYFPSLQEGIMHLLSNEGLRLNVYAGDPSNPYTGFDQSWGLRVWRHSDNQLSIQVDAPFLEPHQDDKVEYNFKRVLGYLPELSKPQVSFELLEEVEVMGITIDGS